MCVCDSWEGVVGVESGRWEVGVVVGGYDWRSFWRWEGEVLESIEAVDYFRQLFFASFITPPYPFNNISLTHFPHPIPSHPRTLYGIYQARQGVQDCSSRDWRGEVIKTREKRGEKLSQEKQGDGEVLEFEDVLHVIVIPK